jgi:3-methylcrotonyl-CoA carboxylase beta subunit
MRELVGDPRPSSSGPEGGGPDAVKRHKKRGKLLARERIERLVDPAAPSELAPLAPMASTTATRRVRAS